MLFYEENDKSHEDTINELKNELEETFTSKVNEIMNDKKELKDKLKEAQNEIKLLNNKNNALSKIYDEKINDEKIKHESICEEYEAKIKQLNNDKMQLQKKTNEPMIKINKLLEEKSSLQNEIYKYKDKLQKSAKEKDELEKTIKNLKKEKTDLIIEKENLISNMNHIDSRIKAKGPKTTDMTKRYQNIGPSSMNMIRTDNGVNRSERKKLQSNISVDYSTISDRINNTFSGRKNNIYYSAQKGNSSFYGQKTYNNSTGKKLVCTCGLCEKDGRRYSYEVYGGEKKSEKK
jgi:chromosome segregation ATPase